METKKLIELIKTRRSIRKFLDKPLACEILEDIIDCARYSPSARNIQPWEFIVVTKKETLKELSKITAGFGDFLSGGSACIAVFCKDTKYYLEDGSAATMCILLALHAYGLGACWIAGDKKPYAEKVKQVLKVPNGYKLISLIAIGYPDESPLPKKRSLKEVLHWEKF